MLTFDAINSCGLLDLAGDLTTAMGSLPAMMVLQVRILTCGRAVHFDQTILLRQILRLPVKQRATLQAVLVTQSSLGEICPN